jgi:adenosine deaminase CECR1
MSLDSWKQLALWSIEYSCLNDEQKAKSKRILMKTWAEFCAKIVKDYSGLMVSDDSSEINEKVAKGMYEAQKNKSS